MSENTLQDALSMALGEEGWDLAPFIGELMVDTAATAYATWMFERQAESPDDEDVQIAAVRNAIAAAYIAGCLDTSAQPVEASHTVTGKSGATYNFYFN